MAANFDGTYIHKDDIDRILKRSGLILKLENQPETRRAIVMNGDPPQGATAPIKRNDATQTLTVG